MWESLLQVNTTYFGWIAQFAEIVLNNEVLICVIGLFVLRKLCNVFDVIIR